MQAYNTKNDKFGHLKEECLCQGHGFTTSMEVEDENFGKHF